MKTGGWLILWIAIAGLGTWQIQTRIDAHNRLHQPIDALLARHNEEISAFEQELKRAAREAETRRKAELEIAFGGPILAAFKNPQYSLREALQQAAVVCAPTNTLVRADVDRFTEFTVSFESATPISTNEIVATTRKLIPVAKTYLDAVRFSVRGKMVAELDRTDIEFINDWTRAPDQRIAMLLPRESQSRIVEDAAAVERLRDEQRIGQALDQDPTVREKAERADRAFRQATQDSYTELTMAFQQLRSAVALDELRSLRDLDERDKHLHAAIEHANRAEKFWLSPAKAWERLLESQGISGELRELLVKGFPTIFRSNPGKTARVFEALRGEIESARYLLRMLTNDSDKWRFSSEGVVFRDEEFARRFERAQAQFREDAQASEAALRGWHEAVGP